MVNSTTAGVKQTEEAYCSLHTPTTSKKVENLIRRLYPLTVCGESAHTTVRCQRVHDKCRMTAMGWRAEGNEVDEKTSVEEDKRQQVKSAARQL